MTEGREFSDTAFEAVIQRDPPTVLHAEWLRDGRVALGTRHQRADGEWEAGELHVLDPAVCLDLSAWLSPIVLDGWLASIRERQGEPLKTAHELYGEGPAAAEPRVEPLLLAHGGDQPARVIVARVEQRVVQGSEARVVRLRETPWIRRVRHHDRPLSHVLYPSGSRVGRLARGGGAELHEIADLAGCAGLQTPRKHVGSRTWKR